MDFNWLSIGWVGEKDARRPGENLGQQLQGRFSFSLGFWTARFDYDCTVVGIGMQVGIISQE